MKHKNNIKNRNEETGNIKQGWLKRFLNRLAQTNRKYPETGCRH